MIGTTKKMFFSLTATQIERKFTWREYMSQRTLPDFVDVKPA
jgi:hypothetical protein